MALVSLYSPLRSCESLWPVLVLQKTQVNRGTAEDFPPLGSPVALLEVAHAAVTYVDSAEDETEASESEQSEEEAEGGDAGQVKALRACALEACAAREVHTRQFKQCAACRAVKYCCREHQTEHWPAHKAACKIKAARKAAAEGVAGRSSDA